MTKVVLFNVKYSPNVGDGLISECLEWALAQDLSELTIKNFDLSGRAKYGDVAVSGRSLKLKALTLLPPAFRRLVVKTALRSTVRTLERAWSDSLHDVDIAIIGGGSLFQDDNLNLPLKLSAAARTCARANVPVAIHSVGVSLPWSDAAKNHFSTLASCNVLSISTRDHASVVEWERQFDALLEVKPVLSRDPALIALDVFGPVRPLRKNNVIVGLGVTSPEVLAYHANEKVTGAKDFVRYIADVAAHLLALGFRVTLFTNGASEDEAFLDLLMNRIRDSGVASPLVERASRPLRPADLHGIIGNVDAVVAHRLHASILGYALCRPIIGLSWDQKVLSFFESVGLGDFVIPGAVAAPDHVASRVRDAVSHGVSDENRRRFIAEARGGLRQLAAATQSLQAPTRQESSQRAASSKRMSIVVGIATAGRPKLLSDTIAAIKRQTRPPDCIIVCPASVDCLSQLPEPVEVIYSPEGLPIQRNAILDASLDQDIVVFFDDDFLPESTYLEEIERAMIMEPTVSMVTGTVLEDGIGGPGFSSDEAHAFLRAAPPLPVEELTDVYSGYGCNMAIRMDSIRVHEKLRFDGNLPFYAWLEDVDFSRSLAPHGRIVKSARARGVHLGSKTGRSRGLRVGYSQIANPIYLMRKGTMRFDKAMLQIFRNVAANAVRVFAPEYWIDRFGRLRGNIAGLCDLFLGKLHPRNILVLSVKSCGSEVSPVESSK